MKASLCGGSVGRLAPCHLEVILLARFDLNVEFNWGPGT